MYNHSLSSVLPVLVLLVGLLAASPPNASAQSTGTITGSVLDATDGQPLIGANVTLREDDSPDIVDGTATNTEGTFALTGIPPGDYILSVRFVGYQQQDLPFTLEVGESRTFNVSLRLATSSLETVVVSASRRQEKVLDAPASISVLGPEELQQGVSISTVEKLRETPGIDMAQTGIDRREVVLRGFNNAFNGSAFVLTDYRQAAVPSLAANIHSIMPNLQVDVEQVEVVRGPGSALYGPGVDSGVVHYFTKDPFDYPGTTINVSGGQRGYFGAQFRQAGVVSERFGYKVTGQFARADEWNLNPGLVSPAAIAEAEANEQPLGPDTREVANYRVYDSRDAVPDGRSVYAIDQDGDGAPDAFRLRREDLYRKYNVNGLLQYRVNDETTLSLNGGFASLKGVVQSGIGTLQADGFGYTYGQVRLQSGGLFAQVFVNGNDAGDQTYVYGTGNTVVDKGLQWNGQVQYDFGLESLATQFIAGADANLTTPRTEGAILGRNEGDDRIREYGLYTQSTTDLSEKFALTLAARGDYNNIVDNLQISPRAALVYKATPSNTFRASYNRSFSSPSTNSNFLDIGARTVQIPNATDSEGNPYFIQFRGFGAARGFSFDEGQAAFLVPSEQLFGREFAYSNFGGAYTVGAGGVAAELSQALQAGVIPESLQGTIGSLGQLQALVQLLGLTAQQGLVSGQTNATEFFVQGDDGRQPFGEPSDITPLQQTTTQTIEAGYKGLLGDRFVVQLDGYYERKEDFISPLRVQTPFVTYNGDVLSQEVATALGQLFGSGNATIDQLVGQLGLSDAQAAALLGGLVGGAVNGQQLGIVQPDVAFPDAPAESQDIVPGPNPNTVGGFLSYRNFGQIDYWGIDASVEFQASDALRMFTNASFVSDDFFDNEELDETDTNLNVALNAPSFKMKGGVDYAFENGVSVGATANYVEGFPVRSGPYVGDVDTYFLLDLRAGYDVPSIPGLRLDVSANNVLDNEHRQFVGAPELGITIFGSATYTLR